MSSAWPSTMFARVIVRVWPPVGEAARGGSSRAGGRGAGAGRAGAAAGGERRALGGGRGRSSYDPLGGGGEGRPRNPRPPLHRAQPECGRNVSARGPVHEHL